MCSDVAQAEPVEWYHAGDCVIETRVGSATFRYHAAEMRMEFRGKDYYGVASEDIDRFVRNRSDR